MYPLHWMGPAWSSCEEGRERLATELHAVTVGSEEGLHPAPSASTEMPKCWVLQREAKLGAAGQWGALAIGQWPPMENLMCELGTGHWALGTNVLTCGCGVNSCAAALLNLLMPSAGDDTHCGEFIVSRRGASGTGG
jgi:hypothetical protein